MSGSVSFAPAGLPRLALAVGLLAATALPAWAQTAPPPLPPWKPGGSVAQPAPQASPTAAPTAAPTPAATPRPTAPPAATPAPAPAAPQSPAPAPAVAKTAAAKPAVQTTPTSSALNLKALLADPVEQQTPFRILRERRNWLARQGNDVVAYEKVADDFEKMGAYYPATEVLWFAEKITDDETRRAHFEDRLRALQAKSSAQLKPVDAALQIWASDSPVKAIDQLHEIIVSTPYSEMAHYQLGYRTWLSYLAHDTETNGQLSLAARAELFRACYVEYLLTIELDPLYSEAYYQLNQATSMLAGDAAFNQRTQNIRDRALAFMSTAIPALEPLDNGDRTPKSLAAAGDALAEVEQYAYAVFAYQAALAHAGEMAGMAAEIKGKIDAILKDKIPLPGAAKPAEALAPAPESKAAAEKAAPPKATPAVQPPAVKLP